MSRPAARAAPGSLILNRYLPVRPLGSGGSGSVWLAREVETGRDVALKVVTREGTAGSRAEREAATAARLRHPRCLRAHALARDAGHVYIVYEYVQGRTLREAIRAGEVSDPAALEVAAQVLEGLAHAHAHGVVHRDVKPANVLLAEGRGISVKLFDFGLALMHEEESLTAVGDIPGTLAYISPERLRGEAAGPAADVWAVGVLLWETLAGFHPFWVGTLVDTAKAIEKGAPTLQEQRPDLPRPIVSCVDRALSVAPGRRPTAAGLAGSLRAATGELRRRPVARPSRHLRPATTSLRGPSLRARVATEGKAVEHGQRAATAVGAAAAAGLTAHVLPFFPSGWPLGLAAVAAVTTLLSERAGVAFCLAVPLLPLGNYSFGLAALYGVAALAALAAFGALPAPGCSLRSEPGSARSAHWRCCPCSGLPSAGRRGARRAPPWPSSSRRPSPARRRSARSGFPPPTACSRPAGQSPASWPAIHRCSRSQPRSRSRRPRCRSSAAAARWLRPPTASSSAGSPSPRRRTRRTRPSWR